MKGDVHEPLARLKADYPTWRFNTVSPTANTGPEIRYLTASRGGVLLVDPTEAGLRIKLARED